MRSVMAIGACLNASRTVLNYAQLPYLLWGKSVGRNAFQFFQRPLELARIIPVPHIGDVHPPKISEKPRDPDSGFVCMPHFILTASQLPHSFLLRAPGGLAELLKLASAKPIRKNDSKNCTNGLNPASEIGARLQGKCAQRSMKNDCRNANRAETADSKQSGRESNEGQNFSCLVQVFLLIVRRHISAAKEVA